MSEKFRTEFVDFTDEYLYFDKLAKEDTRTNYDLLREALHLVRIVWHRLGSDTAVARLHWAIQDQIRRFKPGKYDGPSNT